MRYFRIIITVSLLAGCCGSKTLPVTEKEIVTVIETLRDTTVTVQQDASMIQALLECDENRNVVIRELTELRSGLHVKPPQLIIRDNILTATATVDSFGIYVSWKEREKHLENVRTVTVTEVRNELTGWQWFQIWFGRIAALIIILIIIITLKLKFRQ